MSVKLRLKFIPSFGKAPLAAADSIPAIARTLVSVQSERSVSLAAYYVIVFPRAVLNSKTELRSLILRIVSKLLLNLLLPTGNPPVAGLAREKPQQ